MASQENALFLSLEPEPGDDPEELAELTGQLQQELLALDVEDVALVSAGETPQGAKAVDPATWGTLLVTVAASGGVLTTLIGVLQSWLNRQERRSLMLEIDGDKLEVTGISSEEQQQLINNWLSRHRGFVLPNE